MKCFAKFVLLLAAAVVLLNAAERFDYLIRADFFAGLSGDQSAMDRAMKLCSDTLAENPKHAEAMVWHGSGLLYASGQQFSKGEAAKGAQLWGRGMQEMAAAVALAPDNPGVLILRGATLLMSAPFVPDPQQSRELTLTGIGDYRKVLEIQQSKFDSLSGHSRGELLFGLAAGYDRLGDTANAKATFERLAAVGKSSGHDDQARQWLSTGTFDARRMSCTGCHTGK